MEENKQEEVKKEETKQEETALEEAKTPEDGAQESAGEEKKDSKGGVPTRSLVVWCLGGIYLIYTGYSLCKNVLDGVEGGSTGFMVGGVIFCILGAALLVLGVRGVIQNDLRKKAEADAAKAQEETAAAQQKISDGQTGSDGQNVSAADASQNGQEAAPHKMSISERARLASRLDDAEDEESEEDGE